MKKWKKNLKKTKKNLIEFYKAIRSYRPIKFKTILIYTDNGFNIYTVVNDGMDYVDAKDLELAHASSVYEAFNMSQNNYYKYKMQNVYNQENVIWSCFRQRCNSLWSEFPV